MKEPKKRNGVSYLEAAKRGGAVGAIKKLKRIEEYNKNPILCNLCKYPIPYEKKRNKFCGHSCSASFNNLGIRRNYNEFDYNKYLKNKDLRNNYAKRPCLYCEGITVNKKFCGRDCLFAYKKQILREKIEETGRIFNKADKWYLIEIRGHKCERCSTEEWMKEPIPLDTHHKDGDSDNNYLYNLLLICPNCHRQTNNHGSKNKTNSKRKQYRKKRYDQGLSY